MCTVTSYKVTNSPTYIPCRFKRTCATKHTTRTLFLEPYNYTDCNTEREMEIDKQHIKTMEKPPLLLLPLSNAKEVDFHSNNIHEQAFSTQDSQVKSCDPAEINEGWTQVLW